MMLDWSHNSFNQQGFITTQKRTSVQNLATSSGGVADCNPSTQLSPCQACRRTCSGLQGSYKSYICQNLASQTSHNIKPSASTHLFRIMEKGSLLHARKSLSLESVHHSIMFCISWLFHRTFISLTFFSKKAESRGADDHGVHVDLHHLSRPSQPEHHLFGVLPAGKGGQQWAVRSDSETRRTVWETVTSVLDWGGTDGLGVK